MLKNMLKQNLLTIWYLCVPSFFKWHLEGALVWLLFVFVPSESFFSRDFGSERFFVVIVVVAQRLGLDFLPYAGNLEQS